MTPELREPTKPVLLSGAMREVIERMKRGETLMWFGDNGPEISGRPMWPKKRTVRAMVSRGLLVWGEAFNETQRQCGIFPLLLAAVAKVRSSPQVAPS